MLWKYSSGIFNVLTYGIRVAFFTSSMEGGIRVCGDTVLKDF